MYSQQEHSGQDDLSAIDKKDGGSKGTTPFEAHSPRSHLDGVDAAERTAQRLNMYIKEMD